MRHTLWGLLLLVLLWPQSATAADVSVAFSQEPVAAAAMQVQAVIHGAPAGDFLYVYGWPAEPRYAAPGADVSRCPDFASRSDDGQPAAGDSTVTMHLDPSQFKGPGRWWICAVLGHAVPGASGPASPVIDARYGEQINVRAPNGTISLRRLRWHARHRRLTFRLRGSVDRGVLWEVESYLLPASNRRCPATDPDYLISRYPMAFLNQTEGRAGVSAFNIGVRRSWPHSFPSPDRRLRHYPLPGRYLVCAYVRDANYELPAARTSARLRIKRRA